MWIAILAGILFITGVIFNGIHIGDNIIIVIIDKPVALYTIDSQTGL